jgi:hypothetical protein
VKFAPTKGPAVSLGSQSERFHQVDLTQEGGGIFQILWVNLPQKRVVPADRGKPMQVVASFRPRSPSLSSPDPLHMVLVRSFQHSLPGFRLSAVAMFLAEIPARIGHSETLDTAIAGIIHCHSCLCRGISPGNDLKQGDLYAKSLLKLQEALKHPIEGYSDNTLAACAILGQVEILGGGAQGNCPRFIAHAGGASKLIQMRGPHIQFHQPEDARAN